MNDAMNAPPAGAVQERERVMSNVMKELKAEISRLARKEINKSLAPVKKVTASQRSLIAGLRRQVYALQKELNGLKKVVPALERAVPAEAASAGRFWITGKGVKALRKRLGLTQAEMGRLAGVSGPAVVNWEKNAGKLGLRKATAGKLQQIRGLKKRAAAALLGGAGRKTGKTKGRAKA